MADFFAPISNGEVTASLPLIIGLLLSLVVGVFFVVFWYKKRPKDEVLIKVFATLQVIEFLSVNIWYWWADYLLYPLPLYHSRISKLVLIFFAFAPKKYREKLRGLLVYAISMGFAGSIAAFVYPNSDKFAWPHLTHVGYFGGHFILLILGMCFFFYEQKNFSVKDFFSAHKVIIVLNLFIVIVARLTQANYSYFLKSPLFDAKLQTLGPVIFTLIIHLAYAALFTVGFLVVRQIGHMTLVEKSVRDKEKSLTQAYYD